MSVAAILAPVSLTNFNGLTENSAIVGPDTIPFYDDSAAGNRKIKYSDLQTAILSGVSVAKPFGISDDLVIYSGTDNGVRASFRTAILIDDLGNLRRVDPALLTCFPTTTSGAGGLDTGTIAINTWYYLWVISSNFNVTLLASLSSTAPTLPSGYTFMLRIGVFRVDGSSNVRRFWQSQQDVFYSAGPAATNLSGSQGSSQHQAFVTASLSTVVPPNAKLWFPQTRMTIGTGSSATILLSELNSQGYRVKNFTGTAITHITDWEPIPLPSAQSVDWQTDGTTYAVSVYTNGYRI